MINTTNRTFVVGSEWLYYKIYCGVKTADIVLLEVLKPLTESLIEKEIIKKWFFIRYSDPKPHLRFRIELINLEKIEMVIQTIKKLINPYLSTYQIWDIKVESYKRELERYGSNTIEDAELFFYYDSCQIQLIIKMSNNDEMRFLNLFRWLEFLIFSFDLKNEKQRLEISLNDLLASFIHMSINRCFRSKQRLYEMMLYDFLFRKNKSKFVGYGLL